MNEAGREHPNRRIRTSAINSWTTRAGFRKRLLRPRRAQPCCCPSLNQLELETNVRASVFGFLFRSAGRRLRSVRKTRFRLACIVPWPAPKSDHGGRSAARKNWAVIELNIENHGMAESLAIRKRASNGSLWSETEIDVLVEHWQQGLKMGEIAALLGRSKKSVVVKASRLGLTRRSYLNENHIQRAKRNGRTRSCLLCRARFYSEGPGNRICAKCKQGEYWETGGDSFCSSH